MKLSLHHVSLPKDGEKVSGDAVVVRVEPEGALLAVIDALGHGPAASPVADRGKAFLEGVTLERDVRYITEGLHEALRGTRGAAAMCCLLKKGRIEGCGIGNVELRSSKDRVPVVLTPGILGVSLQRVRTFEARVSAGARIYIYSDGVSPRMDLERVARLATEAACAALMRQYRRTHDDATLLVADIEAVDLGS